MTCENGATDAAKPDTFSIGLIATEQAADKTRILMDLNLLVEVGAAFWCSVELTSTTVSSRPFMNLPRSC